MLMKQAFLLAQDEALLQVLLLLTLLELQKLIL